MPMTGTSTNGDIWVFASGSPMWRPGFPHREAAPALPHGYHRAFCTYPFHHRAGRDRPGWIPGLARSVSSGRRSFPGAAAVAAAPTA